jgi:redox-sensitive bicupin YhaK (pirin superfamily)
MIPLKVHQRLSVQALQHGEGFRALGIRADADILDPFLMVDHYWMSQPTFGAHPHAGLSAVTYMFDDAQTGFRNRDSHGNDSIIRPGDLHWTVSGSGVIHDEVPVEPGRVAHGLQIFVNLAEADKHVAPRAIRIDREHMPVVQQASGAQARVVFGRYDDGAQARAPVETLPTDATLLDVTFAQPGGFSYSVPAGHTAILLVVSGNVRAEGTDVAAGQAVAFSRRGGLLKLHSPEGGRAVLFLGTPLKEPVVRRGPFAMTNAADLARAAADYQAGRMGHL